MAALLEGTLAAGTQSADLTTTVGAPVGIVTDQPLRVEVLLNAVWEPVGPAIPPLSTGIPSFIYTSPTPVFRVTNLGTATANVRINDNA